MSDATDIPKEGGAMIEALLQLTHQMVDQIHDADFLLKGVDQRQALMDACDAWGRENPEKRKALESDPNIRQMVEQVLSMDQTIVKALEGFKKEVQKDVSASTAQQKVMGYLGNTISASGSYMDVKLK